MLHRDAYRFSVHCSVEPPRREFPQGKVIHRVGCPMPIAMLQYIATEQINRSMARLIFVARDVCVFAGHSLSQRESVQDRQMQSGWVMSGTEKTADVGNKTSLGDLERVVKVRKYEHCRADYMKLAMEPNTMPELRDRWLRIALYYQDLADTEPAHRTPRSETAPKSLHIQS